MWNLVNLLNLASMPTISARDKVENLSTLFCSNARPSPKKTKEEKILRKEKKQ